MAVGRNDQRTNQVLPMRLDGSHVMKREVVRATEAKSEVYEVFSTSVRTVQIMQ